jgi:hypothetical protein
MTTWAVKDHNGQILPDLLGSSRLEVECKLLPARYDVFRLHVSPSYRALCDRALRQVLEQVRWRVVEIKPGKAPVRLRNVACDSYAALRDLATSVLPNRCRVAESLSQVQSTRLGKAASPPVGQPPAHRPPAVGR